MIRTFIAITIPESPELRTLHSRLAQLESGLRPVSTAGLHVTLKFLGDTDERKVPEIATVVQRIAARQRIEEIRLVGLGAFPNAGRPAVVWVGMRNATMLAAIAAALDEELKEFGFVPEARGFQPHLTMLRLKTHPPDSLIELLTESTETDFGTIRVETIELFRSELLPQGPRYTVLAIAPLASTQSGEPGVSAPESNVSVHRRSD